VAFPYYGDLILRLNYKNKAMTIFDLLSTFLVAGILCITARQMIAGFISLFPSHDNK